MPQSIRDFMESEVVCGLRLHDIGLMPPFFPASSGSSKKGMGKITNLSIGEVVVNRSQTKYQAIIRIFSLIGKIDLVKDGSATVCTTSTATRKETKIFANILSRCLIAEIGITSMFDGAG